MITAFQANAFQNNAFQIAVVPPTPILIDDTHDGIFWKKKDEEEIAANQRRKKQVLEAYEFLVEGKSPVVDEIVAPFVKEAKKSRKTDIPQIDFDKFLDDMERVDRLWQEYLKMDDEEILLLL
jgi:hypothetical protein